MPCFAGAAERVCRRPPGSVRAAALPCMKLHMRRRAWGSDLPPVRHICRRGHMCPRPHILRAEERPSVYAPFRRTRLRSP